MSAILQRKITVVGAGYMGGGIAHNNCSFMMLQGAGYDLRGRCTVAGNQ